MKKYAQHPNRDVRETCEIALGKIEWDHSEEGKKHQAETAEIASQSVLSFLFAFGYLKHRRVYTSVDPAPPTSRLLSGKAAPEDSSSANIESLKIKLLDQNLPLFERYRAMFALRNIGTPDAVDALASGFTDDSPLFKYASTALVRVIAQNLTALFVRRHEIAFVFGQLLSTHSVPALIQVLNDSNESDMVRHEAAEALGGIATPEVLPHLKEWLSREDSPRVVRESCQIALDMWEVGIVNLSSGAIAHIVSASSN